MKVLFVSPEVNPIVRTGGLGDVVGSLPIALKALGVDVRVICPLHKVCQHLDHISFKKKLQIQLGTKKIDGILKETRLGETDVPVYLVDIPILFDRAGVYADESGDFSDNAQRAFALCQAALQTDKVANWTPDVIHAHDWMAAPVCGYLNGKKPSAAKNPKIRSVLTVHNLQHQGVFSYHDFQTAHLPDSFWGMDGFEKDGSMNLLKGGIQHADKITTVSPTYAEEIRTPEYGCGLESCLQYRGADLIGILNGIDLSSWDPSTDPALPRNFTANRPKSGKQACKQALLSELNLETQSEPPLYGVVSRLYHQKGLDILLNILPQLMAETHASFAILGSGDGAQEEALRGLSTSFPGRIASVIGFDDGLARRIFAGSDFFIMPSRFEPCGLAQQYAMRYGSLPIVRRTGGLADTVNRTSRGEKLANGFVFNDACPKELWKALKQSLDIFANQRKFSGMRQNAMSQACGWENAAKEYIDTYRWSLELNKSST